MKEWKEPELKVGDEFVYYDKVFVVKERLKEIDYEHTQIIDVVKYYPKEHPNHLVTVEVNDLVWCLWGQSSEYKCKCIFEKLDDVDNLINNSSNVSDSDKEDVSAMLNALKDKISYIMC